MKVRHPLDGRCHWSEIKLHSRSPAHVRHASLHARELTRPMLVGGIVDSIVFGQRGYVLYEGKRDERSKEWIAFRDANPGKYIAIASELSEAMGAAEAVRTHPIARDLLDGCDFQRVMQWEAYGLECAAGIAGERGGFDAINSKPTGSRRSYIADLKVTSSTEPGEMSRHAIKMLWHAQGAWYLDGARALCLDAENFYIIGVEPQPPHCVTVMQLGADAIEYGHKQVRLWTERHRACEEAEEWPEYAQTIVEMAVPEWIAEGADE